MENQSDTPGNDHQSSRIEDVHAYCGFHCSRCPAYRENIKEERDRMRVHAGWKKIYGLDIPAEVLCCDGCRKPDEEHPHRIGADCPIRSCALDRHIPNCGFCQEYPCERMDCHLKSVEGILPDLHPSPEDHKDFIEPYLCRGFLDTQHADMTKKQVR